MKKDKVAFVILPGYSPEAMNNIAIKLRNALADADFEIVLMDRQLELISKKELLQAIKELKDG